MVGFIFGGEGMPKTPQELARLRAMATAIAPSRAPKDVGEGLNAVGNAILYRSLMGKANKGEAAGTESANSAFASLLGGGAPSVDPSGFPSAPQAPGAPADMAPPSTVSLDGSKESFINALLPEAMKVSQQTGVDPRIIVAQAAQETGWGKSAPGNNYFGIKSHGQEGGQNLATQEVINGQRVNIRDNFRQFGSPAESVQGYGEFITQNPRYKPLREAQGLDAQLEALQASGYATDPNYSRSVGAIARAIQVPGGQPQIDPARMGSGGAPMVQGREGLAQALMQQRQAPAPGQQAIQQQMPQQEDPRAQFNSPQLNAADPKQGILQVLMAQGGQRGAPMGNPAQGAQSASMGGSGLDMNKAIELMNNPFLDPGKKAVLGAMLERQMQAQDPVRQMQLQKGQLEIEQMRNPKPNLINAGDGRLYDPASQQWITAPGSDQNGFRKASPEEAAQYGAPGGQFGPDGRFYPINPPSGTALSVDPTTGAVTFQQGAGVKPLTEGQSKDTVYATRAEGSLPILDQFGEALTSAGQRAMDMDPTGIVRGQQSPEFQKARQAGNEFLQAVLRKDTGAAITADEMESYGRTYLPAPGDGPEVLAQKKVARLRALEAMKAGMPPQAILQQEKALANSTPKAPVVVDGFTIEEVE